MKRRSFMVCGAAALAGCGPKLAKPFNGLLYVASSAARSLSVVNLSRFKLSKQIQLGEEPMAVVAAAQRVFALTPANGTVHEIEGGTGTLSRKYRVASSAISMRVAPDGNSLWISTRDPHGLVQLDFQDKRITRTIRLTQPPFDFDLSLARPQAVVGSPAALIDLTTSRLVRPLALDDSIVVRFRADGKQVLAAQPGSRQISIADAETGKLMVKLPVAIEPERFCFKLDGGQMFVTGRGMDAVVIVSPYQTSVGETLLAGRAPGAMAVDNDNLYVANPSNGDLTVIAIDDRTLLAKIAVGQDPVQVIITPDNQYVLVLNRGSSDLSVIRTSKIGADLRRKGAPLFTVVPLGAQPVSGAICSL